MTHLIMMAMCLTGFAALALATERQQEVVFARVLEVRVGRWLQVFGWSALAMALIVAVRHWGWALGLVICSGHTSLCAGLSYLILVFLGRFAPRHRRR